MALISLSQRKFTLIVSQKKLYYWYLHILLQHTFYQIYVEVSDLFIVTYVKMFCVLLVLCGECKFQVYMQCIPWNCPEGVAVQPVSGTF